MLLVPVRIIPPQLVLSPTVKKCPIAIFLSPYADTISLIEQFMSAMIYQKNLTILL
ncbi:hypothetical protein XBFM1_860039 [Xenorhabdus bovienii str. feltiae Moldova]|uniref:Uncharacterized protein n=2 Tax=Xenorhabdus bovienii TaxID=40576 RepID=A0A0B6XBY7_XENBV|nr:hypothetical protein XBFM1_860039 [Xenorhabdus bovienii str. feltiae Moldova]CDM91357.1 protein of unknown function [Xenorhabdus bovienii]